MIVSSRLPQTAHTDDQTFHLILSQHLYAQALPDVVVILECATTCGHDTQLMIALLDRLLVFLLQLSH